MNHPLTDEMCENIAPMAQWVGDIGDTLFRHCDMRAAADWQLERDAEELKIILYRIRLLQPIAIDALVEEFKKAMRPQENN